MRRGLQQEQQQQQREQEQQEQHPERHSHPRRHETGLMSTPGDSDNDKIKWNMQAQRAIDVQLGRGGRHGEEAMG